MSNLFSVSSCPSASDDRRASLTKQVQVGPSQTISQTEAKGLSALSEQAGWPCGKPPAVRTGGDSLGIWLTLCRMLSHIQQSSRSRI